MPPGSDSPVPCADWLDKQQLPCISKRRVRFPGICIFHQHQIPLHLPLNMTEYMLRLRQRMYPDRRKSQCRRTAFSACILRSDALPHSAAHTVRPAIPSSVVSECTAACSRIPNHKYRTLPLCGAASSVPSPESLIPASIRTGQAELPVPDRQHSPAHHLVRQTVAPSSIIA